jgi:hypothetical protein
MKLINLSIILCLIAGIVFISGCTDSNSQSYNVTFMNATDLNNFNDAKALDAVKPNSDDNQLGFKVIDYGNKTVNGVNVYYNSYTDDNKPDILIGDVYFQKNNKWYMIEWNDSTGNPNKNAIDNEISNKINSI